jgi:alpha-tubulin suppressor-like RCC1 family protein
MALRSDGTVWTWGGNGRGQLGDGSTAERHVPGPVSLAGAAVSRLAAAGEHSLAIHGPEGLVSTWGLNIHGQLGNGRSGYAPTPVQVPLP